jgi:5'-nucleotidase
MLGFPSAVMSTQEINQQTETQLRVAFDLDAVLFSDESEKIFKQHGLKAFQEHEKKNVDKPLEDVSYERKNSGIKVDILSSFT